MQPFPISFQQPTVLSWWLIYFRHILRSFFLFFFSSSNNLILDRLILTPVDAKAYCARLYFIVCGSVSPFQLHRLHRSTTLPEMDISLPRFNSGWILPSILAQFSFNPCSISVVHWSHWHAAKYFSRFTPSTRDWERWKSKRHRKKGHSTTTHGAKRLRDECDTKPKDCVQSASIPNGWEKRDEGWSQSQEFSMELRTITGEIPSIPSRLLCW